MGNAMPRTALKRDYEASPATLVRLEAISNPRDRLLAADAVVQQANSRNEEMCRLRAERAYLARLLRDKFDWKAFQLIGLLEVGDKRVVYTALNNARDLPLGQCPTSLGVPYRRAVPRRVTEKWALATIREVQEEFNDLEAAGRTAAAIRQDIIRGMTETEWATADIARLIGLSTAAVSQIRLGSANGKRPLGNRDDLVGLRQQVALERVQAPDLPGGYKYVTADGFTLLRGVQARKWWVHPPGGRDYDESAMLVYTLDAGRRLILEMRDVLDG